LQRFAYTHSVHFIQIFKQATSFFSHGTLNLAAVIPAMDLINKVLITSSDLSYKFSVAIHAALTFGKKTIDKYYNKADQSEVCCTAMSMYHSLIDWSPIPDCEHLHQQKSTFLIPSYSILLYLIPLILGVRRE